MRNNYMIPANSKKSQLILGFFTPLDLTLFASGCTLTILLLLIIHNATFSELIIIILPAVVTGFLVMPVLYYHNILQLLINIFSFFTGRRRYYWRGWCVYDDTEVK